MNNIQEKVDQLGNLLEAQSDLDNEIRKLEYEITREMETIGARELPHKLYDVQLKLSRTQFDSISLKPLLENELIADELHDSKAYVPAHEEIKQIPEKWDGTQLKKFTKYGGEIAETIGKATMRTYKLQIKRKKGAE